LVEIQRKSHISVNSDTLLHAKVTRGEFKNSLVMIFNLETWALTPHLCS